MLDERLPVTIDPIRFAETGRELKGRMPVAAMKRLKGLLLNDDGEVGVELDFGIDEEGVRYLHGRLDARLALLCQRCMEGMTHPVAHEFYLAMVESEAQAETLASRYDPLQVSSEPLYLQDLVEDELILALPIVPRHANDACGVDMEQINTTGHGEPGGMTDNPFAVLATMKTTGKA